MASEVLANSDSSVRQNLVTIAINFLTNPSVQHFDINSKKQFLRSKGLTELEIDAAFETCANMLDVSTIKSNFLMMHSRRSWFRDQIILILAIGGFSYGCYWIYKNCIKHLLFVEKPKEKSTVECIDELRKSLEVLNTSVSSLRGEMQVAAQHNAMRSQLDIIKSDLASVKGILLNRNQFPSLKTRAEPPSIPAWQRATEGGSDVRSPPEDKKKHRARAQRSDSAGSNSSEGEHATKNSDSSLEIIVGVHNTKNSDSSLDLIT